jgi:hypothetical protein
VRDIRPLSARCTTNVGGAVGESFFSTTPTVSCEMLSQKPSSIALSANNRSVQRAWPWGAVEQAKAVILARAVPSILVVCQSVDAHAKLSLNQSSDTAA